MFTMKFLDGTPVDTDYQKVVSGLIRGAANAEDAIGIDELEEAANRSRVKGELKVYEVTAAGFDGSSDATDDLVFWIAATSAEDVHQAIQGTGAVFGEEVLGCSLNDADFTLPAQAMNLSSALLEKASEHRNQNRPG